MLRKTKIKILECALNLIQKNKFKDLYNAIDAAALYYNIIFWDSKSLHIDLHSHEELMKNYYLDVPLRPIDTSEEGNIKQLENAIKYFEEATFSNKLKKFINKIASLLNNYYICTHESNK